tara:strand:+ start:338 stop:517 length:180 start_codon:yes stop_codon:yes gene_type:complete
MKIKLEKNWRAFGQVNEAGTIMEIKDKKTIAYLKDNGYIKDKKNKKEKKAKEIIAEENN